MKEGSTVEKCYQMYLMSLKRLEGDDPDLADEVIVAMWEMIEKLIPLTHVVDEQQKELSEYYHKLDILESREAVLTNNKSLNGA